MKSLLVAMALSFATPLAFSEDKAAIPAQQHRKRDCKKEATGMQEEARKVFMKDCLANKQAAIRSARAYQQEKARACNTGATSMGLKDDERKAFMGDCLMK